MDNYVRKLWTLFLIMSLLFCCNTNTKAYENHCWNCGYRISSDFCARCVICGWYKCIQCSACACEDSESKIYSSNNRDDNDNAGVIALIIFGFVVYQLGGYIHYCYKERKRERKVSVSLKTEQGGSRDVNTESGTKKIVINSKSTINYKCNNEKNYNRNNKESVKGPINQSKFELSCVKVGCVVHHKTLGEGKVVEISNDRIVVSFNGTEKKFQYPSAFQVGFLSK